MSFFGLTAFGPENIIRSSQIDCNCFTLYTDEEYQSSFQKLSQSEGKEQYIESSQIMELLTLTLGFPPLDEEISLFRHHSKILEDQNRYHWKDIKAVLDSIRNFLLTESLKSKRYDSYGKYCYERYKHIRRDDQPNSIFKMPVSSGQQYGFYKFEERNLNNVHLPKVKCEETKYAEKIVQTGKHFMK